MQRLILFFIFTLALSKGYSQNFWTYDTLSTDGKFHTVATVGNNIYLFDGWQTRGNSYAINLEQMEIINTITGEHNLLPVADSIWGKQPITGSVENHYRVFNFNHYLLYLSRTETMYIFDTQTQTWSTLDIPFGRTGIAMAANDSLLIFGGGGILISGIWMYLIAKTVPGNQLNLHLDPLHETEMEHFHPVLHL